MLEGKLRNKEIRDLWPENFPKRLTALKSKTLCRAFCLMVEERAADIAIDEENVLLAIHRVLDSLGIPRDKFYQFEKESEDE